MSRPLQRTSWKMPQLITLFNVLVERFDEYKTEKKNNKVEVFYANLSSQFNCGEKQIRDVIKNLGKEYRQLLQQQNVSGAGTDEDGARLRESKELYEAFHVYYGIYHPRGGSQKPEFVMTPGNLKTTSDGKFIIQLFKYQYKYDLIT